MPLQITHGGGGDLQGMGEVKGWGCYRGELSWGMVYGMGDMG